MRHNQPQVQHSCIENSMVGGWGMQAPVGQAVQTGRHRIPPTARHDNRR